MKKNTTEKQQLYTSTETLKLLAISSSTLRSLVEKGLIEKVTLPGYKHGYYTKASVDQYLKEKLLFDEMYSSEEIRERKKEQMTTVRQKKSYHAHLVKVTTRDEMRACLDLSQELFGVGRELEDERMKILEKNPDTYYILKGDDEALGWFSIMPLKPGNLERVLGQTLPVVIEPEQIAPFEPGSALDLYLTAIGTKPGLSLEAKREYGAILVRGLVRLIIELGVKGVEIGTIAARSNMLDGVKLLKHVGFTEIEPLTPERRTFVIRIKESGIPFIRQYKKDLAESRSAS